MKSKFSILSICTSNKVCCYFYVLFINLDASKLTIRVSVRTRLHCSSFIFVQFVALFFKNDNNIRLDLIDYSSANDWNFISNDYYLDTTVDTLNRNLINVRVCKYRFFFIYNYIQFLYIIIYNFFIRVFFFIIQKMNI